MLGRCIPRAKKVRRRGGAEIHNLAPTRVFANTLLTLQRS